MQGIFAGHPVYLHDSAWTVLIDLAYDELTGIAPLPLMHQILITSGFAGIAKE